MAFNGTVDTQTLQNVASVFRAQSQAMYQAAGNFRRASLQGDAFGSSQADGQYSDQFNQAVQSVVNLAQSYGKYADFFDQAAQGFTGTESTNTTNVGGA